MLKKTYIPSEIPNIEQFKKEFYRLKYRSRFQNVLRSTIYALIVASAVSVLISVLFFPIFRIYGNSMSPTLEEGDIIVSAKKTNFQSGDLVVFYMGNKILIKRYIAGPGQWVDIDEYGNVYVDNIRLTEPYISEKSLGDCNIQLPYQVPEGRIFCLGDHRKTSVDSRNTAVGCISKEQIVGKIMLRIWPFADFGILK